MRRFLVKGSTENKYGAEQQAGPSQKKQLKLADCKKVVRLTACDGVGRSTESLQSAQKVRPLFVLAARAACHHPALLCVYLKMAPQDSVSTPS